MSTTKRFQIYLTLTALAGALLFGALAAQADAALRHFDGTVTAKSINPRSFTIATESGNVRIKVTASTEFERIAGGFSGLKKGAKIEVDAVTGPNGLTARQVEPQGGNGGADNGGDDNGGADDGGRHGGNDDGPNHD